LSRENKEMLFILTGNTQIGKTRWLERLILDLQEQGVECVGVVSPGIWREHRNADGAVSYEKLGIESWFLPGGERAPFAQRRDLAQQDEAIDADWESAKASLGWVIPDEALQAVNAHFDLLGSEQGAGSDVLLNMGAIIGRPNLAPCFLVVDELGMLELKLDGGFTSAIHLLEAGPTACHQHALIIVRDWLLDLALERFKDIWGEVRVISPDDKARELVLNLW
jgi:nucleoside-triphosphatase THEP1